MKNKSSIGIMRNYNKTQNAMNTQKQSLSGFHFRQESKTRLSLNCKDPWTLFIRLASVQNELPQEKKEKRKEILRILKMGRKTKEWAIFLCQ